MALKRGKPQWTDTRLAARKRMVDDGWPDEQIHDEDEIGWGTIETVHEMIELGIPLPDESPVPVYQKLSESHDELTEKPKAGAKKQDSIEKALRFDQSNLLRIVPRAFTTSSLTVWLAMAIANREWGWDVKDPGEFIDRFITTAMEDYGFPIALYSRQPGASTISKGDGQGEEVVTTEEPGQEEPQVEEAIFIGDET